MKSSSELRITHLLDQQADRNFRIFFWILFIHILSLIPSNMFSSMGHIFKRIG